MSLRKFEILEMIAKGGMAEVYRAQTAGPEGFAKELCVKKILPHLTEDDKFVKMFINEAKLAASLNFANIVSVHDLCVSANREYFIVMEYVNGKDLSDIIRAAQMANQKIPAEVICYIGREVCRGLTYAHSKRNSSGEPLNIIHRDVSPQNILCSFMGEVKITDFGIAKASINANQTAVGILKGKYGYMSPEQAHGKELDQRSDIFNLGIVLYELLVRERCFAGSSDYSTLNLMREAVVTPPTRIDGDIPKDLEKIVLKALSRKPQDRYQTAEEFENALSDFDHQSHSSKLATFVHELFSNNQGQQGDRTTGVLNLSSVVVPAPEKPSPKETAKPASNVEEPAKEAPEEKKETSDKPSPPQIPESAENEIPTSRPEKKKERKPARLKPHPKEGKAKKKPKKVTDKKPVGRKNLKPGWTDLNEVSSGRRATRLIQASVLLVLASAAGFGIGLVQSRGSSYDLAFRMIEAEAISLDQKTFDSTRPILIETVPSGAKVTIDDKELDQATPALIENLKVGTKHRLELTLDAHKGERRDFVVSEEDLTRLTYTLEPAKPNVSIETVPPGAQVRINGAKVGITPLQLLKAKGQYEILIELKKYLLY